MTELTIISVAKQTIKDRDTGAPVDLYRVYCVIPETGEVGSFYSRDYACVGDTVTMRVSTDREGRFSVRPVLGEAARAKKYPNGILTGDKVR